MKYKGNAAFAKCLHFKLLLITRQQTLTNECKRKQALPNRISFISRYKFVLLK